METLNDSIDISQLKAAALGLSHDLVSKLSTHFNACHLGYASKLTPPTLQSRNFDPAVVAPALQQEERRHRRAVPIDKPRTNELIPAPEPQSRRLRLRHEPSQDLSSTVPKSSKRMMSMNGTQSQGDTQPVSQWVYDQFASKVNQRIQSEGPTALNEYNGRDVGEGLHSIQPGETGHVDLLGALEEQAVATGKNAGAYQNEDDIDELSQMADVRAEIFPESRRFQQPKTPATQGTKRKRTVNSESQELKTPDLPTNPFAGRKGNVDGPMNPSQLFKATQALTSPLINIVPSDGLSERPSPDLHNLQRPATAGTLSSPVISSRSPMARAVTEPQTVYVSIQASQEARERQRRFVAQRESSPNEISDDGFESMDTQLRRHLDQKRLEIEARQQFAGVATRSKSITDQDNHNRKRQFMSAAPAVSLVQPGREASYPVVLSDDGPIDAVEGNRTEDETELEEEGAPEQEDDLDELGEENKENVEVPRTASRIHARSQMAFSQPSPSHRVLRPPTKGLQSGSVQLMASSPQSTKTQEKVKVHSTSAQLDAIADSQPSQSHRASKHHSVKTPTRAISEPRSSLDTRILVPHSQSSASSRSPAIPSGASKLPKAYSPSKNLSSSLPEYEDLLAREMSRNFTNGFGGLKKTADAAHASHKDSSNSSSLKAEGATSVEQLLSSKSRILSSSDSSTRHLPQRHPILEDHVEALRLQSPTKVRMLNTSFAIPSPATTPKRDLRSVSVSPAPEQSRPSTLFETAQEYVSTSLAESHPASMSRHSGSKRTSPRKSKRPRTIDEIAADPSPSDLQDNLDVEINILSNEDVAFQSAIRGSSPIAPGRRRRRLAINHAVQAVGSTVSRQPQLPCSPNPPPSSAYSIITPVPTSSEAGPKSPEPTKIHKPEFDMTGKLPRKPFEQAAENELPDLGTPKRSRKNGVMKLNTKRRRTLAAKLSSSTACQSEHRMVAQGNHTKTPQPSVTASNRVFAHFNGLAASAFYPATCLDATGGTHVRYTVRFDDTTVDEVNAHGVKRLELRKGDLVKVDLPGARSKSYIVQGMHNQEIPQVPQCQTTASKDHVTTPMLGTAFPETDIYGSNTVLVALKQPSGNGDPAESETIAVSLAQIYLTQTMWTSFRNRPYTHAPSRSQTLTGLQTPSERPSTPSTPSSRTRRAKSSAVAPSRSMPNLTVSQSGLFKNMAFAITSMARVEDSLRIKHYITSNSGIILESGFEQLFTIPPLARTTSPQDPRQPPLQLTSAAQDLGFTCLIADKHCRRAKFIQALALGIPCLATRWITDCAAKQRILPWIPYLLPAGESAYLGGVVRSRILQPFPVETASLASIFDNRPKLLAGASVLLIMEKNQEQTMKSHPLITHALGASRIARAINLEAAAKAVGDAQALGKPWDWVFSYDKEELVEKRLFGNGAGAGSRRKRSSVGRGKVRVVGNEGVVQSLILGMLIDE
ncbi:hypothetical protein MMC21_006062 [Puttea exsequens]|nr:hypothetical protein [Puttea exsequens]